MWTEPGETNRDTATYRFIGLKVGLLAHPQNRLLSRGLPVGYVSTMQVHGTAAQPRFNIDALQARLVLEIYTACVVSLAEFIQGLGHCHT